MRRRTFLAALPLLGLGTASGAQTPAGAAAPSVTRSYGLTLLDKLELPAEFSHFPYADPDAPKGGEVALASVGTFDSFNPFIVRGSPAPDIARIYDTLTRPNPDEATAVYGHLAETIEVAADRSWVAFQLRPNIQFHDGHPLTAEDVAWTFQTLREQGRPSFRAYYADVTKAVAESPSRIVFHLKSSNRELPLILGEVAVLPKHWWQGRDFSRPLTDPPLGSGAYRVESFDFGRTIAYRRVAGHWAENLPTGKGLNNFDVIRTEYYRDATVAFEAFKAGHADFRQENISKQWATGYDFPAVKQGLVKKSAFPSHLPTGMQGFAMNTRRDMFKDARVRQAMVLAFDFEWCNINLFYGAYTRTSSYYSNSDLASSGIPEGDELALLAPFRDKLPPALFTQPYKLPVTDGSGNNRDNLRAALALLRDAGWEVKERKLVDANGRAMSFEILLPDATFERISLPYVQWLARLGITANVRTVDPAQYQNLLNTFSYDMTIDLFPESDSPGNEQLGFWGSASARQEGSDNIIGVADPVVDALVQKLVSAPDHAHLVTACRALDRVLLWSWYMVPHWHLDFVWAAYWDRFGHPDRPVRTGLAFDSWWVDATLAAKTDEARRAGL
ncbi:MAG: ABC transporter substrate-binding protein [Acidisphaera sp.]|nr:ABC transporter substrate-binding protein [Acidisphaera sp.]